MLSLCLEFHAWLLPRISLGEGVFVHKPLIWLLRSVFPNIFNVNSSYTKKSSSSFTQLCTLSCNVYSVASASGNKK